MYSIFDILTNPIQRGYTICTADRVYPFSVKDGLTIINIFKQCDNLPEDVDEVSSVRDITYELAEKIRYGTMCCDSRDCPRAMEVYTLFDYMVENIGRKMVLLDTLIRESDELYYKNIVRHIDEGLSLDDAKWLFIYGFIGVEK